MGMDIIGKNPKSEVGEYFRNNVWYWRPLWNYCLQIHGDITNKVRDGHSNSGDGLGSRDATKLGKRLIADINGGFTDHYQFEYRQEIAQLPTEPCTYCGATGIRNDQVGQDMGMPGRELETSHAIVLGRTHGWCNACDGAGQTLSWRANYPFEVENVKRFAEFLVNCGGFKIC